jgi:retron-type reverse transcriptase
MKTPLPLLFSYDDTEDFLKCLSDGLRMRYSEEIRRLVQSNLPPIVSWRVLALAIGVSPSFINSLIKNKIKYYRVYKISKGKGNKKRLIEAPMVSLKIVQAWISYNLSHKHDLGISDSAYAFVPGMNGIYEAAKEHCLSKWVLSIDLRDFFHLITTPKIVEMLEGLGYRNDQAKKIAQLTTLNDRLPQGAPSSPVLSNLVFKSTDEVINNHLNGMNVKYTRYADDLTFSSEDEDFNVDNLKDEISSILHEHGWVIAEDKVRISRLPNRLKVHGFLVHNDKPRLTRGYRNKIRLYKHLLLNHEGELVNLDEIKGHVNYGDYIDRLNR